MGQQEIFKVSLQSWHRYVNPNILWRPPILLTSPFFNFSLTPVPQLFLLSCFFGWCAILLNDNKGAKNLMWEVIPSQKLPKSWKIEVLSILSWFTKVTSAFYAFFGLLLLCMPNLWPKGFMHRKFQVVMINGSEIMTSSILKNLCRPKMLNIWLFLPIFILNISAKAIKSHFLYWISKSLMVLGFSEWHLDLPKMLPT